MRSISPGQQKIQIVGAGMSGLLSAYYLLEKGLAVEVFESANVVGGKIQTINTQLGLREISANAILVDAEVERVADKIGLKLIIKSKAANKRWILKNGKDSSWPINWLSSLLLSRFVFGLFFGSSKNRPRAGELLQDWGYRVFGRETTDYLVSPACQGIFGVDARSLSATLVYKYFFGKEKRAAGRLSGSVVPQGGMGEFPKKLREYLEAQGVEFFLNKTLALKGDSPVVLAADWQKAKDFLQRSNDPRGDRLAEIPGVDLYSVNIFFKDVPLAQKPGFGLLFPQQEKVSLSGEQQPLGVLFNACIFPELFPQGSETWIFGGIHPSIPHGMSDGDFLNSILSARKKLWDSNQAPEEFFINRWPQALPLYGIELEERLEELSQDQNGIYLAGNYLGELGLNRLFHRARKTAEKLADEALK